MLLFFFALGLAALVVGAELLVRGSGRLALSFGISPLVVGLTVVAFGTSAPEVAVSVGAALRGVPELAVGNVVGSNVFNVLFILGVSALIVPLSVNAQIIRQEVPILIGASFLLLVQCLDGVLGRTEAGLLLFLLVAYTVFLVRQSRRARPTVVEEFADVAPRGRWDRHWSVQVLMVAVGLGLLVVGANALVRAATSFAEALGISDLVIGLTIVAAGTSLPEVATSIMAAVRGERDIAIGNVVGSNTFNLLGCLGTTGLVAEGGLPIASSVLGFDLWVMLAVALACLPVFLTGRVIARWEGALFLSYYVAYTGYLTLNAMESAWLPTLRVAMLSFVLPLTIVTLVVCIMRAPRSEV
ncbi:MAG: calcium/sodium antiporter [Planctomycetota bacterium]